MADKATKRSVSLKSRKMVNFLENHCQNIFCHQGGGMIQKHPKTHSLDPWLTFNTTQNWGPLRG